MPSSALTRRFAWLAAAVTAAALVPAGAASAQGSLVEQLLALPDETAMGHTSAAGATTADLPAAASGTLGSTTAAPPEQVTQPVTPTQPAPQGQGTGTVTPAPVAKRKAPARSGTTCTRRRGTRTCLTYRRGRLVKRCVTRHGHRRCTRPRTLASASALKWWGALDGIAPVGKILSKTAAGGRSGCSGTVVSRSLVLTAAHCVYKSGYHTEIAFVPAMKQNGTSYTAPYGEWTATRWWAPDAYTKQGDGSQDFALIEIAPLNGRQIGDVVGMFSIAYGPGAFSNGRTYVVGYPASGWFASDGRNGLTQYACDSTYESNSKIGTGYLLWSACYLNRGASGGPWFVPMANGTWSVAGVNSQCDGFIVDATHYCDPYATRLSTSYFSDRILSFWNTVAAIRGTSS
jgi:hypothetical protein